MTQKETTIEGLHERYRHDLPFTTLVDLIYKHIQSSKLTPSETRDAAYLASVLLEQRTSTHRSFYRGVQIDSPF